MKILFTGASSFTGCWFVQELARAGHEVTTVFRHSQSAYEGTRRERVEQAMKVSRPHFDCNFGSESFIKLISETPFWDLFCHHAADVHNYKSPDFNVAAALDNNTKNLKTLLKALQERGCNRILLTGSVFEPHEGAGSDELQAVSPYGLSKGLTSEVFQYYSKILGMKLGKFVIPNPFGPFEEARFTSFLIKTWYEKKPALVSCPAYVRDNIHVSLLAKAYTHFAKQLNASPGFVKYNPCGYTESQGAFTCRFAKEMESRLKIPCPVELIEQTDFPEPKVRINTQILNTSELGWSEGQAWDELAAYYQSVQGKNPR